MHTIIYLDQNYLSNMAKARIDNVSDTGKTGFWSSIFDDLKSLVLADIIACPELEFQVTEARFNKRLEEPKRKIIDELSWGLRFRFHEEILQSQIEEAARRFLGKTPEVREPWQVAFESDPQAEVDSRMRLICGRRTRINVHFALPNEVVEHDRQLKKRFVNGAQLLLDRLHYNGPTDLPKATVHSKKDLISGCIGNVACGIIVENLRKGTQLEQLIASNGLNRLMNLWDKLRRIGINIYDQEMAINFIESEELLNVPFIDIFGSIYAAIATNYPKRKMQMGDLYDVPTLAATDLTPYYRPA